MREIGREPQSDHPYGWDTSTGCSAYKLLLYAWEVQ
jgi:hypothetical protein